ncbi:MAG: RNA-processing protein [Thermoplasmata archaeon]|nr:RNA-processing protein [Thermoplasmata archaeon]
METSVRVPKNRIAVLIGKKGETRKGLEAAAKVSIDIDSSTGDVSIVWDPAKTDPVKMMKFPELIKAIGRGMSPKKAIKLMEDDCYFQLYDMKEWVGKQHLQQKRMRGRLIGSEGKIRRFIEQNTGCEMAVYGTTVVLIGDESGLPIASNAVERILRGSEHGTVIKALERERRDQKLAARRLEYISERGDGSDDMFDQLVPGLSDARQRSRRYRSSQVDPDDDDAIEDMMELAEDESVNWSEE